MSRVIVRILAQSVEDHALNARVAYRMAKTAEGVEEDQKFRAALAELEKLAVAGDGLRRVLLDVEGSLLAYWTEMPEAELQRLLLLIRAQLGHYEPSAREASG